MEKRESEAKMELLRQDPEVTDSAVETDKNILNSKNSGSGQIYSENPYEELFARNEDMAAWLVVDGTVIDYPVMQTMEDEAYYLKRDFDGNEDEAGCLILDTDSDLYGNGTTNLIIHGHNMKAGTMFGSLDEYRNEDFYSEHKYMELYTETERRCYEVMAVFYSQVYYTTDQVFKYYQFFQAQDEEGFQDFYENVKKMSLYDTGVTAELGDCFLTLSTCTYHVEDGRFVVVAKEIRRTEAYRDGCVRRIGTRSL
jgi:sortase B